MNAVWLPLIGFVITLYALSIGRGGGLLYVGILTTLMGVPPEMAISTSLAILVPTTLAGAWSHWRKGNVSLKLGLILLTSGCVGTAAASFATRWLAPGSFKKFVGIVFLWTLLKLLLDRIQQTAIYSRGWFNFFRTKKNSTSTERWTTTPPLPTYTYKNWKPTAYGAMGGMLSGVSGMSGSTAIMAGLLACGCPPIEMIGTSLFAISGISLIGFLMHLKLGMVNWLLVAELSAGSVLASVLSPYLLCKIPVRLLDRYFPYVMMIVISATTFRLLFN